MRFQLRSFAMLAAGLLLATQGLSAQDPTTISGRITTPEGAPLLSASVVIGSLNLGVSSNADGRYVLIVPAARATGQSVELTVTMIGRATQSVQIVLTPGTQEMNFVLGTDPLLLDEIVVTGLGLATRRQQLGVTINSVQATEIIQSREPNLVAALAGKAPNVEVTTSSGDPGAGSYIRIRGANSLLGSNQPLFVVDGQPINNDTRGIESSTAGTVRANRAMDINSADIESIQILKGAAAAAIYGSRAANGVILVTTKRGQPGTNRVEFRASTSFDEVNQLVPLQTTFGQGLNSEPEGGTGDYFGGNGPFSWGYPFTGPVYDHAGELYKTAIRTDFGLTWSGGNSTTDYYLSLGRLDQDGVIKGPQDYARTNVRLRAGHAFRDDLRVSANISYTNSTGALVQQGSNISGIQLGALRTPPDFNNKPYLNENGLHVSYRNKTPTSVTQGRGYDNPFWIAKEISNTADVNRTFGNVNLQYTPFSWLEVNYILGGDYTIDERQTVFPKSSSDFPNGRIVRADFSTLEVDHNLVATGTAQLTDYALGTLTLGQNLNHRQYSRYQVNGNTLILGTNQLDFAVDRVPDEFVEEVRTDGYFAQGTVDLWDQLYVTGAVRLDGSNTFGEESKRYVYPKASVAWDFTENVEGLGLSFAKVRGAFGVAGKQPDLYSNVSAYATGTFTDGWLSPNGLESIYAGNEGVFSEDALGNAFIRPEKTTEYEGGIDIAFFNNRVSLGATYYYQKTTDAILAVDVAPSTGYGSKFANAAEFENNGLELMASANIVDTGNFSWDINAQWATNDSCVLDLAGTEEFGLTGFTGLTNSVVAPEVDANGNITTCHPVGVFYGSDFIRFGNGSLDRVTDVDIDATYTGWNAGDVYLHTDGFPQEDPQDRVIGDANPEWTASFRNSFRLGNNLTISGLIDIKHGGQMWNGTKGALYYFGTHADTEPFHELGENRTFGDDFITQNSYAGPGLGTAVPINWDTWHVDGIGSGFTGPGSQFIEDAGFVKLRDISVAYTIQNVAWLTGMGFTSLDVQVSGRNLKTWTDYTGIDPESNLNGQTLGRGLEYFNNPQTRSFAINFTLAR